MALSPHNPWRAIAPTTIAATARGISSKNCTNHAITTLRPDRTGTILSAITMGTRRAMGDPFVAVGGVHAKRDG